MTTVKSGETVRQGDTIYSVAGAKENALKERFEKIEVTTRSIEWHTDGSIASAQRNKEAVMNEMTFLIRTLQQMSDIRVASIEFNSDGFGAGPTVYLRTEID